MKLRNSERSSFKTCRWRWSWTWRDGLQAREAPRALRFGDLIHQALAAYRPPGRKFGPSPAATFERLYLDQAARLRDEGFDVWSDDKWADALDLGKGMLKAYVETFQDADARFEVISSEQTFQRVIRSPAVALLDENMASITIPAFSFRIVGTIDGVWREIRTGRIVFKEYKTAAAIHEDGLAMDDQPTVYWTYGPKWMASAGLLAAEEADALREILYTFLRKAVLNESRPRNGDGLYLNKPSKEALLTRLNEIQPGKVYAKLKVDDLMAVLRQLGEHPELLGEVSKTQPAPFFHRVPVYRNPADRRRLHERVLPEAREIWLARRGMMPLYKNPGPLHSPNCRGCSVRDACETHEAGGDFQSVLDATTVKWAPYAAHELPERI
jgi:hypothetical protein